MATTGKLLHVAHSSLPPHTGPTPLHSPTPDIQPPTSRTVKIAARADTIERNKLRRRNLLRTAAVKYFVRRQQKRQWQQRQRQQRQLPVPGRVARCLPFILVTRIASYSTPRTHTDDDAYRERTARGRKGEARARSGRSAVPPPPPVVSAVC